MSATAREVTQGMALCTATRRKSCHVKSQILFTILPVWINYVNSISSSAGATMSVVRVSVVAAHGLSVNVPWVGHLTLPLWF